MASNFLSFNSTKTEFLLIGLPAQLAKIHNPALTIPSNIIQYNLFLLLEILVSFLILLFLFLKISYISKSCFSHIRDLRRIRSIALLQLLSSTLN